MTFRVGQKVVCTARRDTPGDVTGVHKTVVGKIYTIRGFDEIIAAVHDTPVGLYFEELVNVEILTTLGMYEPSYSAWRFRPIVERKTDISFAHEILRKASRKDRVPA